jgi:hypothetical protein
LIKKKEQENKNKSIQSKTKVKSKYHYTRSIERIIRLISGKIFYQKNKLIFKERERDKAKLNNYKRKYENTRLHMFKSYLWGELIMRKQRGKKRAKLLVLRVNYGPFIFFCFFFNFFSYEYFK